MKKEGLIVLFTKMHERTRKGRRKKPERRRLKVHSPSVGFLGWPKSLRKSRILEGYDQSAVFPRVRGDRKGNQICIGSAASELPMHSQASIGLSSSRRCSAGEQNAPNSGLNKTGAGPKSDCAPERRQTKVRCSFGRANLARRALFHGTIIWRAVEVNRSSRSLARNDSRTYGSASANGLRFVALLLPMSYGCMNASLEQRLF